MVNIEINGKVIQTRNGAMLIEAADAAGITIPRFCYHSKLSIAASCRMCLVEVEKAPKPLPACATPVTEGMKVFTRSPKAIAAQRSVMEFLLINHPLDCPICDQGGECSLQDLAVGYGNDVSRYAESKRVVSDPNLGSLISTDMTRCIHCTRCVRFGREVAGIMELGAPGRGEHMHIGTYMKSTVNSELSGNVVELCPVGALTSKPFRFTARSWELNRYNSVSPHDCVGSNIHVDVRDNKVMRVTARENENINETWLADRDRFSYDANYHSERLTEPMIKEHGEWKTVDWNTALVHAAEGLKKAAEMHGVDKVGALASYSATTEEYYLLQKLLRGLGSNNIDHRLHQTDFRDQHSMSAYPALGQAIADLESLDAALLIGSNIRKDQPLLAHRLRKAVRNNNAQVMVINAIDSDLAMPVAEKSIAIDLAAEMLAVLKALQDMGGDKAPAGVQALLADVTVEEQHKAIAEKLKNAPQASVLLGSGATAHPGYAELRALAMHIARASAARFGVLSQGGNSAGAWLAGCLPHRDAGAKALENAGMDWHTMMRSDLKAYMLFGVEPELDCIDSAAAMAAMSEAEFVVAVTAFGGVGLKTNADVLLPMATFLETAGSYMNIEGHWQHFSACAKAPGEVRPGWKILRVLGNLLDLAGFEYTSVEDIDQELEAQLKELPLEASSAWEFDALTRIPPGLIRISEPSIYNIDPMVRRSAALQETIDAKAARRLYANAATLQNAGLATGEKATLLQDGGVTVVKVVSDERLPNNAIYLPAGSKEVLGLGGSFGPVQLTSAN